MWSGCACDAFSVSGIAPTSRSVIFTVFGVLCEPPHTSSPPNQGMVARPLQEDAMRYRTQPRTCSEAGSIEAHSEPEERAACERYTLHPFALVAGLLPALIIASAVLSLLKAAG